MLLWYQVGGGEKEVRKTAQGIQGWVSKIPLMDVVTRPWEKTQNHRCSSEFSRPQQAGLVPQGPYTLEDEEPMATLHLNPLYWQRLQFQEPLNRQKSCLPYLAHSEFWLQKNRTHAHEMRKMTKSKDGTEVGSRLVNKKFDSNLNICCLCLEERNCNRPEALILIRGLQE